MTVLYSQRILENYQLQIHELNIRSDRYQLFVQLQFPDVQAVEKKRIELESREVSSHHQNGVSDKRTFGGNCIGREIRKVVN